MTLELQVAQLIQEVILESTGREVTVAAEDRIVETGLLDSLSMVNVVMALQRTFDVDVDITDLNEETFGSAASIATLVRSRKPGR